MNVLRTRIFKFTVILLFVILVVFALIKAATVLKPLAIALILSLLLVPIARKLERKVSHGWASFLCTCILLVVIGAIVGLIGYQANQITEEWDKLKSRAENRFAKVEQTLTARTGITGDQIDQYLKDSGLPRLKSMGTSLAKNTMSSLMDILLILIYTFLLLHYRSHFKNFVIMLVKSSQERPAENTMEEAATAVQGYLRAKFTMIAILAIVYSVGLTIMGVRFGIFYGILAALLSIIPYVGNILGIGFPLAMAIIYNDVTVVILVLALFMVAQLVENYVLAPLLIRKEIDLHPFFSITFAIIGGAIWGATGMIIAIPVLAILYIVFSNVQDLNPYAYLLSEDEEDD